MFFSERTGLQKLLLLKVAAGGSVVEDTATGNPLSFLTDLARPLKSLLIPFTPKQTGSGDPSPENIRPIVPWDGLTVKQGGSNLLLTAETTFGKWINGSGAINNDSRGAITSKINVESSTDYTLSYNGERPLSFAVVEYNASGGFIKRNYVDTDQTATNEISFSTQANTKAVICEIYTRDGDMTEAVLNSMKWQFEKGSRTDYNDTVTETDISFPSTVYGGTLDAVSGVLTVTMVARTYNGTEENWSNQNTNVTTRAIGWEAVRGAKIGDNRIIACNCLKPSNANQDEAPINGILNTTQTRNIRLRVSQDAISFEDFRAFLQENPVTVVCPLVTPQEIQLTPQQITAIKGNNTIWSDANGDCSVTYLKKG